METGGDTFVSAVLGFRRWDIDYYNELLVSCTNDIPWVPGINYATGCKSHASPGAGCHCGFNAWYNLTDALQNYKGIVGAIAGSGRVEMHGRGFRSSEAQIVALLCSEHEEKRIKELVQKYEIPVFSSPHEFLEFIHTIPVVKKQVCCIEKVETTKERPAPASPPKLKLGKKKRRPFRFLNPTRNMSPLEGGSFFTGLVVTVFLLAVVLVLILLGILEGHGLTYDPIKLSIILAASGLVVLAFLFFASTISENTREYRIGMWIGAIGIAALFSAVMGFAIFPSSNEASNNLEERSQLLAAGLVGNNYILETGNIPESLDDIAPGLDYEFQTSEDSFLLSSGNLDIVVGENTIRIDCSDCDSNTFEIDKRLNEKSEKIFSDIQSERGLVSKFCGVSEKPFQKTDIQGVYSIDAGCE